MYKKNSLCSFTCSYEHSKLFCLVGKSVSKKKSQKQTVFCSCLNPVFCPVLFKINQPANDRKRQSQLSTSFQTNLKLNSQGMTLQTKDRVLDSTGQYWTVLDQLESMVLFIWITFVHFLNPKLSRFVDVNSSDRSKPSTFYLSPTPGLRVLTFLRVDRFLSIVLNAELLLAPCWSSVMSLNQRGDSLRPSLPPCRSDQKLTSRQRVNQEWWWIHMSSTSCGEKHPMMAAKTSQVFLGVNLI